MLNNLFRPLLLTVVATPIFLSQPALAHVIWFNSLNNNKFEIIFGHPEQNIPEPLIIEKFQGATAYDFNKNVIPSSTSFENGRLFVETTEATAALTGFYNNGYWLQDSSGSFQNITLEQAQQINFENVSNFVKYGKGLYAWSDTLAQPFGLPIEIIALSNPFTISAGGFLPIQVLYQGDVVSNPLVEYLGEVISVDSQGIALIPIGAQGLQVIEASYTDPSSINPTVNYAATFSAQAIPEPLTILGAGVALGFGTAFKRKITKKHNN